MGQKRIGLAIAMLLVGCGADAPSYPDVLWVPPDAGPDPIRPDAEPPAPVLRIDYIDPDHGPFTGGTEVLLRGRGFVQGMEVAVGGRAVETLDVAIIDDRRATIRTPPGMPGPADVLVTAGPLTATLEGGFTYEAITVAPGSGSVAGGTYVRITGFGTTFGPGDEVTFDGAPLTGLVVISEQELAGFTPAGVPGSADVEITGPSGTILAEDAFLYTNSSDPFLGGLGGGPIDGSLNITVVDAMTGDGVDMAFVSVGDPATSSFTGTTDMFGQITFSGPTLVAPVTVYAAKVGYESSAFVVFDATDATIFLVPIPDPMPGPLPPGRAAGYIGGHILFGDATGIGTTDWGLVPEPRTPNEIKRAFVFTTLRDPFSGNPDPGGGSIINYVDDGRTAWDFTIVARPAALAVVAVAGLYDPTIDPDGPGPLPSGVFQPFAMGVTRGILVGPGEFVEDVAVVIDIPLDSALQIQFANEPPLYTPGWYGPTELQVQAFLDLGGEGVIGLPGAEATLPYPDDSGLLTGMAPIMSTVSDGSYTVFAGAYSYMGANPWSVRVVRGIRDLGAPVVVDEFLGVPRPVDPPNGGVATDTHLVFAPEGATTGSATFHVHLLSSFDGTPLWRMFTRGDQYDVDLPDLSMAGIPGLPSGQYVIWTCYEITIPGLTFDNFNYGHLNANYWSAYSADAWAVQFP